MPKHKLSWYVPGREIEVRDKMQRRYKYTLTARAGKDFDPDFTPDFTPGRMLELGVFEGKYINDCEDEFPKEWYDNARAAGKLCPRRADPNINLFEIKSRLSLQEWQERGWIPIIDGDPDVRGWFQWYCRYWIGRRIPELDKKQIARWRSFARHRGQIIASIKNMESKKRPRITEQIKKHRPRQRQALLQWAYDPFVTR
jgi:hypothetical protein